MAWRHVFRFEAAHWLPQVQEGHPCGRLHGHGFKVTLTVPRSDGLKLTGVAFSESCQPIRTLLTDCCLNYLSGLENPTSEHLARWIWQQLKPSLPFLSQVTIQETDSAGCHYNGLQHQIWKTFRFESALYVSSDPTIPSRLLGHSYQVRLYLSGPLDEKMGWILDYGEMKRRFHEIHNQLDHHLLNDLPGLLNPSMSHLIRWIWDQTSPYLPQISRIDLSNTAGQRISLKKLDTLTSNIN